MFITNSFFFVLFIKIFLQKMSEGPVAVSLVNIALLHFLQY